MRCSTLTEVGKIDPPYIQKKCRGNLLFRPVFVVVGLSASESKFNLRSLFQVVLIGL